MCVFTLSTLYYCTLFDIVTFKFMNYGRFGILKLTKSTFVAFDCDSKWS